MNRLTALLLIALFCVPTVAHADYFKWKDPENALTITFPDTWKRQNNDNPDDIFTVLAPGHDRAKCTVKASNDRRYMIFPPEYGKAVQRDAVSVAFWKAYMRHYDDYEITRVYDNAGLGRWRASYALGNYTNHDGTAFELRRAVMFASLYNDTMYIVECSALSNAYDTWNNDFQSIIKSIDFRKAYHERVIGEYDDFLKNTDMYFGAQTSERGVTRY